MEGPREEEEGEEEMQEERSRALTDQARRRQRPANLLQWPPRCWSCPTSQWKWEEEERVNESLRFSSSRCALHNTHVHVLACATTIVTELHV